MSLYRGSHILTEVFEKIPFEDLKEKKYCERSLNQVLLLPIFSRMPICRFFLRCIFIFPAEIVFIMGIVLRISIFSEHGLFCNDPLFPILATVDSGFELAINKSLP